MNEDIVVPVAGMLMVMVLAIGIPLVIALGRKWQRDAERPKLPDDVAPRLQRMESAIDAIAIEVERISEGQRFTTKLLAERQKDGALLPNQSEIKR